MINIKTTQTSAFKIAIDGISSLLHDANIEFHTTNGITLKEIDKTGRVVVYARLDKDCFETYDVYSNRIVGLDITVLNKCLKNANKYDVLTMSWEDVGSDFKVMLESHNKKLKKTFHLKTLTIPENLSGIKPIDFSHRVTMDSLDFNTYCKDISNYSDDKIKIVIDNSQIIFSSDNDDIIIGRYVGPKLKIECNDDAKPLTVIYDLQYLLLFTKCSNLSDKVDIFIKEGYPIILQYKLASLGELKLVLNQ
jgi:proliferating cell nuclear antigen PCNA